MNNTHQDADKYVNDQMCWLGETQALNTIKALRKNYFDAEYFENRHKAVEHILTFIQAGVKVAFGGSQTTRQLNLQALAEAKGAIVLDHNAPGLSPEEKIEVMRQQQICDVFICSSNAITLNGELYNIDGYGNRVAAMTFGPKKVIVVAGVNKLCADESAAWNRLKTIAAPVNFKRLERPNPCVNTGICADCHLPTRGCRIYVATRRKPSATDLSVFIVNEVLGF